MVDRILCHYSYRREGNPSFWQLSASCCWPYVHAMTASKPLCLGDRLSPINSNEPQTGWSPRQQTTVTLLPYSLWNFFNLCSGFSLGVLSSFSLLCSPRAFIFFSFLTSLFLLPIGFLDVSFSLSPSFDPHCVLSFRWVSCCLDFFNKTDQERKTE